MSENPYHPVDPKWHIVERAIAKKKQDERLKSHLLDMLSYRKKIEVLIFTTPYPPMRGEAFRRLLNRRP